MAIAKVFWRQDRFIKELTPEVKIRTKRSAWAVKRDAQALVPKVTGDLADTIRVVEIDGGKDEIVYLVTVGSYEVYYGMFVELGTPGRGIPKHPFMRPALERNRRTMKNEFGVL